MTISPTLVFRRADGVSCQSFGDDDDGVLLALDSGYLYACNPTAVAFLTAIDGRRNLEQIALDVVRRYRVEGRRVLQDLSILVAKLLEEKLIVLVA